MSSWLGRGFSNRISIGEADLGRNTRWVAERIRRFWNFDGENILQEEKKELHCLQEDENLDDEEFVQ